MISTKHLISPIKLWLIIPAVTIAVSLIIIIAIKPVWGIDFVGGSLIEIEAPAGTTLEARDILKNQFDLNATAQATQDGTVLIRTHTINDETHNKIIAALEETGIKTGEERRFENIGPTIGQELRRKTAVAVSIVVVVMIMYLAYTFRQTKGLLAPWKFGVAATYALVHDLVLVTALFVIFGKIWGAPIDTLFVTAQLAILGYSVNDTIVMFDRLVRERTRNKKGSLLSIMNRTISVTLGRSLNTSLTTLLVLLALLIFGGSTIRWFIAALTAGTITGAYSSIFVANPLLWKLAKPNERK